MLNKSCKNNYSNLSFKAFLQEKLQENPIKKIIKSDNSEYGWKEIEICSQIIAADLSRMGVKKGSHVALYGANSINWIFTFYAIQKLGAIAQLLNFRLKYNEVEAIVSNSDAEYICIGETDCKEEEIKRIKDIKGVYNISSGIDFTERFDEYKAISSEFRNTVEADDACVMVFTSGSTGTPKGALLSAYNILNAALSNVESCHLSAGDKVLLILPMFHIFGLITGLCSPAISDAYMVLAQSMHIADILRTIEEEKITVMHSVPTIMLMLAGHENFSSDKVSTLRNSILSGAAVSPVQMKNLMEKFPNTHFASSYGMSEMAPVSITDYDDLPAHITDTVGKPIKNIGVKVFNTVTGDECKPGEIGEIGVRGFNLMTCYYKVPIEKQAIDEKGWLHTGDLGKFDENGYLIFVGRLKELIIRGGENIVPNEVASVISTLENVKDAKVVGIPDELFGETVGAAVILKDGVLDAREMKKRLLEKLAGFKVPSYIVQYNEFPLLGNGKVDMVNLKKDMVNRCKND